MLEAGGAFVAVCLDSPSAIDGVILTLTGEDSGERLVAARCHPLSPLRVDELLAAVEAAADRPAPVWKPLRTRSNIFSRARLLPVPPGQTVLRLEMSFRAARHRAAGGHPNARTIARPGASPRRHPEGRAGVHRGVPGRRDPCDSELQTVLRPAARPDRGVAPATTTSASTSSPCAKMSTLT